jgi:hypothetical protein
MEDIAAMLSRMIAAALHTRANIDLVLLGGSVREVSFAPI